MCDCQERTQDFSQGGPDNGEGDLEKEATTLLL